MTADVLMGLLLALKEKRLNSAISRAGMLKKFGIGLLVAVSYMIEPFAPGVPIAVLTCLGFIVSEGLSVVENGARLGIPIPKDLVETLSKLRGEGARPITVNIKTDGDK